MWQLLVKGGHYIYVYIFIVCHLTFINSIGLYIVSTLSINILIKKCDIFLNTFDLDNINARGIKPNAIRSEKSRNGTRWILWNWVIFHLKIWSMELVVQWLTNLLSENCNSMIKSLKTMTNRLWYYYCAKRNSSPLFIKFKDSLL